MNSTWNTKMIDIVGINKDALQSTEPDIGWLVYFERIIIGSMVLDEIKNELGDNWSNFFTGWMEWDYKPHSDPYEDL